MRAQDPTYNVASDWATTYPTTASILSATSATWGAGKAWSAGELSFNVRQIAGTNAGSEGITQYYTPNQVGYLMSGATTEATYTYTVPFQAYQLNPGTTVQQQVGPVLANQVQTALPSIQGFAPTLPHPSTGSWTVGTATTTSGTLQEVAAVERVNTTIQSFGFTTTAFEVHGSGDQFDDGANGGSVAHPSANTTTDSVPGVMYDYATTNSTSTQAAVLNQASGSLTNTVMMEGQLGPSYVAWTAPAAGTISSIAVNGWDLHEGGSNYADGGIGMYVFNSATGPSSPLFSAPISSGTGLMTSTPTATVGTATALGTLSTFVGSGSPTMSQGAGWTASNLPVTAGEIFYIVADPQHNGSDVGGNHDYGGGNDPLALQVSLNFIPSPEPSSMVLLGLGGVGLFVSLLMKKHRSAA